MKRRITIALILVWAVAIGLLATAPLTASEAPIEIGGYGRYHDGR